MIGKNKSLLFIVAVTLLFGCTLCNTAFAYTTGFSAIDKFRNESVDVYQFITFNYTVIGGGGSFVQTIRSEGVMVDNFYIGGKNHPLNLLNAQAENQMSTFAEGNLGSETRGEIIPSAKYVWNVPAAEILKWDLGWYNENTTWVQQRTNITGYQKWLNVTEYINGENTTHTLDPTLRTGTKFQMALLPAEDLAYDWCRKHNAVLNSVDAVNTSIKTRNIFVDYLTIQQTPALQVDTNLDDGYDIIPVNGSIAPAVIAAVGWLILKIAIAVAAIIFAVSFIVTGGNSIFDFSSQTTFTADQNLYVNWTTPEVNQTQLYQDYLTFCGIVNQEPSAEGYYEWTNNHYDNIRSITPELPTMEQNNNWTDTQGSGQKNILQTIIGFIADIIPIVIAIILIVAFIFAFLFIVRKIRQAQGK